MSREHIQLGINFANLVRSTLGPKGMNKLVIGKEDKVFTNDGATIINTVKIYDPIAELFKNLARNQEKAVGDGTTTATILTGELLKKSLELLDLGMHNTNIIDGYNLARRAILEYLSNEENTIESDREKIMRTAFGSKLNKDLIDIFVKILKDKDVKKLNLYQMGNANPFDSEIIKGYAFEGYTINDRVPEKAEGKVAVMDLTTNLENTKMSVRSSEELVKVNRQFRQFKKDIVEKLVKEGVKIFFFTDTNPELETLLTEANIMSVVNYKRDELDKICLATGCKAIADPEADFSKYVGYASSVKYIKDSKTIIITNPESKTETLIIKGQTKEILEETKRAVEDVLGLLKINSRVVIGGGSIEIELGNMLRNFSKSIGGKEQIAIDKFADALESIPVTLAKNCGFDAMELLANLKALHSKGEREIGIDPLSKLSNAKERGILEPALMKAHAINSATDVCNMILKLDEVYKGEDLDEDGVK